MLVRALLLTAAMLRAADDIPRWPQFRGPEGSGIAEGRAPVEFNLNKSLLWKATVPDGFSSPSVWGDRIFITGGDRQTRELRTLCLDRRTGKLLWDRKLIADKIETLHEIGSPATASPALDGERVYVYFGSYGLICWDMTGRELWTLKLPSATKRFGSGTSPILAGDLVVLNRDDNPDGYLLGVDKFTGKVRWKQPYEIDDIGGAADTATPVLWGSEIVIHRGLELAAFDSSSGSKKWWVKVRSSGTGTPVIGPGAVYVATWFTVGEPDLRVPIPDFATMLARFDRNGDGAISFDEFPESVQVAQRIEVPVKGANDAVVGKAGFDRLDLNHDGKIDGSEWEAFVSRLSGRGEHGLLAIKPGGKGDVTATHVLWREARGVAEIPAPLYSHDRVYMVTNGGIVTCMKAQSGEVLFRKRLGTGGAYYSSPVAADGNVYFASGDGVVSVIQDSDRFEQIASNEIGGPIFATPAIAGGGFYLRAGHNLFAFGQ